uniref:Uncharacterized protein n=1 Tax=Mycena chlorophos TaxID=658473 RepID=A0ABQ0LJ86_MYCCL|nr:predicted protein [Mycena chlorophos]
MRPRFHRFLLPEANERPEASPDAQRKPDARPAAHPTPYADYEKFNFGHAQKPFFEFPIMPNGSVYTGQSSPGADRVVFGSIAADYSSAIFCAVITHTGAKKYDGFVECKDDTVNTHGDGVWDVERRKGRGLEAPEGREHLKPEHVKLEFWKHHREHEEEEEAK